MSENFKGTIPPPVIFIVFLVLSSALHWGLPMHVTSMYQWIRFPIGGHLLFVAGVMAIQSFRLMRNNNTPIDFNKPTTTIVTKGPFRFTRNPLYLSLLMLYLGIAILVNSLWFFPFLLWMFIVFNAIAKKEESYLEDRFGDAYMKYKSKVRRWL